MLAIMVVCGTDALWPVNSILALVIGSHTFSTICQIADETRAIFFLTRSRGQHYLNGPCNVVIGHRTPASLQAKTRQPSQYLSHESDALRIPGLIVQMQL